MTALVIATIVALALSTPFLIEVLRVKIRKTQNVIDNAPVVPETKAKPAKPAKHAKIDNKIRYVVPICGFESTFDGFDVTDKMIALGAEPLPHGIKYAFFEEFQLTRDGYDCLTDTWDNALVIIWVEEDEAFAVSVDIGGDVEENFLNAANKVYKKFKHEYVVWEAEQKALAFAKSEREKLVNFLKDENRLVLGEPQPWKED